MRKLIFIMSTLILLISSCKEEKILDNPKDLQRFSEDAVWGSIDLANGFVAKLYNDVIGNRMYWDYNGDDQSDNVCLFAGHGGPAYDLNVVQENMTNEHDEGWNQYGLIRKANIIIQKATDSEVFSENEKELLVAQGKFLRAVTYWSLAIRFGGVIKVDKVLASDEDFKLPRMSIKETYDFIIKDLDEAATGLPVPEKAPSGLASKGAAMALKSRVALQAAAYTQDDTYYDQVISAATAVEGMGYQLDARYEGMFNDFNIGQTSPEIIFGYYRNSDNTNFQSTLMQYICPLQAPAHLAEDSKPPLVNALAGWPDRFPVQNLVNAYLVIDKDGTAKEWDKTTYYKDFVAKGGYVSKAIYQKRDQRFYSTIVQDSSQLIGNTVTMRDKGNMTWRGRNTPNNYYGLGYSQYFIRKGLYQDQPVSNAVPTNHHRPLLRLGEVLLNKAEAYLRKGQEAEARDLMNMTRTVHGKLPEMDASVSGNDLLKEYKRERRVELAFENDRYWSLLRWAKAEGKTDIPELNEPVQEIHINADGTSFEFLDILQGNNNERRWTSKRFLFPVPLKEIQANENLTQNEGW